MSIRDALAAERALVKNAPRARILTIDIEFFPGTAYWWSALDQFLPTERYITTPRLACFAAKWLGDKEVLFHDEREGAGPMAQAAWDLLTEADVVITYNGHRYDLPHLNETFADHGLGPAAPFKHVDLIKTNKQRFALPSRKLDYLAGRLGVGSKMKHEGFDLWRKCMDGDTKAWDTMRRYNMQDVRITERVYLQLLPWLDGQTHIGVIGGANKGWACPQCGSTVTAWHKKVRAFVREYQLYRCDNPTCRAWSRSNFLTGEPVFTRPVR